LLCIPDTYFALVSQAAFMVLVSCLVFRGKLPQVVGRIHFLAAMELTAASFLKVREKERERDCQLPRVLCTL
jgi:hypothetical protein